MDPDEIAKDLWKRAPSVRGYARFLIEANRHKRRLLEIAQITLAEAMRDDCTVTVTTDIVKVLKENKKQVTI